MTDRTDYMRRVIGVERAAYERDGNPHGNPLHVWSAYCAVRELGQPVPDWILAYFDRCAVALMNLDGRRPRWRESNQAIRRDRRGV